MDLNEAKQLLKNSGYIVEYIDHVSEPLSKPSARQASAKSFIVTMTLNIVNFLKNCNINFKVLTI